jgi:hypothetical protein
MHNSEVCRAGKATALRLTACMAIWSAILLALASRALSQERPYFVTYSHEMEEPGNLEIETYSAIGRPNGGNRFWGNTTELEYGVKAWWTTEFYLDSSSVANDSIVFTGFRWEHRIRPLAREHWINPVLYAEFENINGADKGLKEIVGHDGVADLTDSNAIARQEKKREVELKLILGSNFKGWNVSENLIAEKNLSNDPWEFGYAVAASRPLKLAASSRSCAFCADKFTAGVEMYGGLGDRYSFGLHDTSHYLGPALNWSSPHGFTLSFSPQFGLNDNSLARIYRFGVSYEVSQIFDKMRALTGAGKGKSQ